MVKRGSYGLNFLVFTMLSVALMIVDARSTLLQPVREALHFLNRSVEFVVELPAGVMRGVERFYPDSELFDQYEALRQKYAKQQLQLQRLKTLESENLRLKTLLNVSQNTSEEVYLSHIKNFDLENYSRRIVLRDGSNRGVHEGQVVFEPNGVLGQVSSLGADYAVVTLITDAGHILPVEIERTGLRTLARGSGRPNQLTLPYVERSADIRKGDVLVTSGVGGRFPVGYKVAQIEEVVMDSNRAFLDIQAKTFFNVGEVRDVLLIKEKQQLPPLLDAKRPTPAQSPLPKAIQEYFDE